MRGWPSFCVIFPAFLLFCNFFDCAAPVPPQRFRGPALPFPPAGEKGGGKRGRTYRLLCCFSVAMCPDKIVLPAHGGIKVVRCICDMLRTGCKVMPPWAGGGASEHLSFFAALPQKFISIMTGALLVDLGHPMSVGAVMVSERRARRTGAALRRSVHKGWGLAPTRRAFLSCFEELLHRRNKQIGCAPPRLWRGGGLAPICPRLS